MKSLVAGLCFISAQAVTAQSICIPRTFAEEDIVASYEKINADKRAELAAVQKEYANFAEQVRTKKSTDSKFELTGAFADAAAIAYIVNKLAKAAKDAALNSTLGDDLYILEAEVDKMGDSAEELRKKFSNNIKNIDDKTKEKLQKQFGKKYEKKVVNIKVNSIITERDPHSFANQLKNHDLKKALAGRFKITERFSRWIKSLKGLSFVEQMKKTVFTVGKKIGFASMIAALPLGAYLGIIKMQEQQRLVQLTAEQDEVMKQALLLELFLNQKSFAELAATRAQLNPEAVCPST